MSDVLVPIAVIAVILIIGALAWPKSDVLDLAPGSSWPVAKIVLTLSAVIGICGGAYYGSAALKCSGLEEDYLNAVSGIKSTTASLSVLDDPDVTKALIQIRDQSMRRSETILVSMHEQCGSRSAETALRKGSEILLP